MLIVVIENMYLSFCFPIGETPAVLVREPVFQLQAMRAES